MLSRDVSSIQSSTLQESPAGKCFDRPQHRGVRMSASLRRAAARAPEERSASYISPVRVSHVIECPTRTPISAAPMGVRTEILPCEMSASSG